MVPAGARDAYVASGWEVLNQAAFDAGVAVLEGARVPLQRADAALCAERGVQQLVSFADPSGNRHELVWGFKSDFIRFASPVGVSRFVTGSVGDSLGMGHTVLPASNFEATARFLQDVMGFGLSDIFNFKPAGDAGPTLPIHFMHCNNGRHHSLAIAGFPVDSGCVHIMVEVENMPEVGRALDRMAGQGVKLMATLGQHTNDRMTSFYMRCPSNFDIEYGYGGAVCDWQQHIVHEFTLSGVEDAVTIDDVVRRAHFDIGHRDVHIYGRARRADEGALDAAFNVLVASLEQIGPSPGARP